MKTFCCLVQGNLRLHCLILLPSLVLNSASALLIPALCRGFIVTFSAALRCYIMRTKKLFFDSLQTNVASASNKTLPVRQRGKKPK